MLAQQKRKFEKFNVKIKSQLTNDPFGLMDLTLKVIFLTITD